MCESVKIDGYRVDIIIIEFCKKKRRVFDYSCDDVIVARAVDMVTRMSRAGRAVSIKCRTSVCKGERLV